MPGWRPLAAFRHNHRLRTPAAVPKENTVASTLRKTRVELNNAVFSLPDLVAKAEGYFE